MDIERLQTHAGFLRAVTRSLLRDEDRAEDAVQQTWLAAIERGRTEAPRGARPAAGSARGWLGRVAVNFAKRSMREESRRAAREKVVAERRAASARSEGSPAQWAERRAATRAVVDAVFALDEPYRTTVMQRYYDGRMPMEIAAAEGVSVETVKTRLRRALERLRARLDAYDDARIEDGERGDRTSWRRALAPLALGSGGVAEGAVTTASGVTLFAGAAKGIAAGLAAVSVVLVFVLFARRGDDFDTTADEPSRAITLASIAEAASVEPPVDGARVAIPVAESPRDEPPVVRVVWSDGTPAADIGVRISEVVEGRRAVPILDATEFRTGRDGTFVPFSLEPGRYRARIDRGGTSWLTIGDESVRGAVTLRIPRATDVAGVVVDARGAPVSNASILLSVSNEPDAAVVGHADDEGRFTIRDVTQRGYLGARSDGYAMSDFVLAERPGESPLRLALRDDPTTITGVVLDGDGAPIERAGVVLGNKGLRRARKQTDGTRVASPGPFRTLTNARGEFHLEGVPGGQYPLEIAADGFGPWRTVVTGSSEVRATLQPAAYLIGRVLDAAGAPVSNARLDVAPRPSGETFRSEIGELLSAFSNDDGAYRLGPLPAGSYVVKARAKKGKASNDFAVGAGTETTWIAVLDAGRSLRGTVVREGGEALPKASITLYGELQEGRRRVVARATTDRDGAFEVSNLETFGERFMVEIRARAADARSASGAGVVHRVEDVTPGDAPVRLVVPDSVWPTARLRGVVVDASHTEADTSAADARVWPIAVQVYRLDAREPVNFVIGGDGPFDVGPVPAGASRIRVYRRGLGSIDLGTFEIEAGDTSDLGTIRLEPSRGVVFEVTRADGADLVVPTMQILDLSLGFVSSVVEVDGRLRAERPLARGTYYFAPQQYPLDSSFVEFTTDPEREVVCAVHLEPGVGTTIAPEWPSTGLRLPGRFMVHIADLSGRVVQGYDRFVDVLPSSSQVLSLRPGVYRATARDGSGRSGETVFEVGDVPVREPVRIPVR